MNAVGAPYRLVTIYISGGGSGDQPASVKCGENLLSNVRQMSCVNCASM